MVESVLRKMRCTMRSSFEFSSAFTIEHKSFDGMIFHATRRCTKECVSVVPRLRVCQISRHFLSRRIHDFYLLCILYILLLLLLLYFAMNVNVDLPGICEFLIRTTCFFNCVPTASLIYENRGHRGPIRFKGKSSQIPGEGIFCASENSFLCVCVCKDRGKDRT